MNDENWGIVVRSVISAIPWIGGPAGTILSELKAKKEATNIKQFLDALKEEQQNNKEKIEALQQDKENISQRVLLLEETVEHLVKEWDERKIPLYAKLFIENVTSNNSIGRQIGLVEQLSELTSKDIMYLRNLVNSTDSVQILEIHAPLRDIIASFSKLEARGLIAETDHGNRSVTSMANSKKWDERWKHKFYTATPIGQELIQALGMWTDT